MDKEQIKTGRNLLRMARVVSAVFTPFTIPFLSLLVLFLFSYLRVLPASYKAYVLGIVCAFTLLIPALTIQLYRRLNGWAGHELGKRERRYIPILLTLMCYVFCWLFMQRLNLPLYMVGIVFTALLVAVVCFLVNLRWKLSEHMAGMGAVIGGLAAFSELFNYNPVWWLCLFILAGGLLGSARIILRHHTLGEVAAGFAVGLACSLLVLHPATSLYLFRFLLF